LVLRCPRRLVAPPIGPVAPACARCSSRLGAGVGRLGGILGPVLGGLPLSAGASLPVVFATFASVAIAGAAVAAVRRGPSDSTDPGEHAALTPGSDRTVLD